MHSTKPATFARDRRKANDDGRHEPALIVNQRNVRRTCFREIGLTRDEARAQAIVDASTDNVLTATGELDASCYGDLRRPSGLVDVRGVDYSYDGDYYVKSVTHRVRKGEYKQRFTLTRGAPARVHRR